MDNNPATVKGQVHFLHEWLKTSYWSQSRSHPLIKATVNCKVSEAYRKTVYKDDLYNFVANIILSQRTMCYKKN